MKKIHILSADLIAKIAAGEVIERPAYAVKELIENAIDAKATSIRIDLENSGIDKIQIIDNGVGMSKDDLEESYKPHTTSKVSELHDLAAIQSFGFRGEALSSISAISDLSIKSRVIQNKTGHTLIVNGNDIEIIPGGMAVGTTVTIENLFYSVPARKKFLKSLPTEFRYIMQIISEYALAFPDIHFFITHNRRVVLNVPQNQTLIDRIQEVFGNAFLNGLVPINHNKEHISVSGFISNLENSQSSTAKQFIFVNGRSIKSKVISAHIKETYGTLLPPDLYPAFILFITIPYDLVDVNVHPRKEEVSFYNEQNIRAIIQKAVESSLYAHNLTVHDNRWKKSVYKTDLNKHSIVRDGGTTTYAAKLLKKVDPGSTVYSILQIHNLYVLVQTETGFWIVDQHAAHERILFEQFEQVFNNEKKKTKQLKLEKPLRLHLSVTEKELIKESTQTLNNYGFILEYKTNNWYLTAVPELLKDRNFQELITELIQENKGSSLDTRSKRMLAYLACRSAVKAGDILTNEECKKIIQDLEKTKNPYTCPHGRPIRIEIELEDMHKMFKRK